MERLSAWLYTPSERTAGASLSGRQSDTGRQARIGPRNPGDATMPLPRKLGGTVAQIGTADTVPERGGKIYP